MNSLEIDDYRKKERKNYIEKDLRECIKVVKKGERVKWKKKN